MPVSYTPGGNTVIITGGSESSPNTLQDIVNAVNNAAICRMDSGRNFWITSGPINFIECQGWLIVKNGESFQQNGDIQLVRPSGGGLIFEPRSRWVRTGEVNRADSGSDTFRAGFTCIAQRDAVTGEVPLWHLEYGTGNRVDAFSVFDTERPLMKISGVSIYALSGISLKLNTSAGGFFRYITLAKDPACTRLVEIQGTAYTGEDAVFEDLTLRNVTEVSSHYGYVGRKFILLRPAFDNPTDFDFAYLAGYGNATPLDFEFVNPRSVGAGQWNGQIRRIAGNTEKACPFKVLFTDEKTYLSGATAIQDVNSRWISTDSINAPELTSSSNVSGKSGSVELLKAYASAANTTTTTPFTPTPVTWDLYARKYGKATQPSWLQYDDRNFTSALDSTVQLTNTPVVATQAVAAAYTGVAINGTAKTITLSAARTMQEVYDYAQAWASTSANLRFEEGIASADGVTFNLLTGWAITPNGNLNYAGKRLAGGTVVIASTGLWSPSLGATTIRFAAVGSYLLGEASITGTVTLENTSGGAVTVQLPAGTSYTNTGPSITVDVPTVTQGLAFTGLVAGSQVVVYTTGTTTELFRDDNSGTTETWSRAGGTDATVDYTIQRAGHLPIRVVGVTVNSAVLATPVQQVVDRSYAASSGLTFGTTATVNTGTSRFTLTTATTGQNWYSFMIESWIAQSALRNVQFPLSTNGPNSFTLDGWEFSAGLTFIRQDGIRYLASGVATAIYSALYSVDTAAGLQIRYQQTDGGTTVDASNTGQIDQIIQVYGDATHGNFDRRSWLTLKVQADGFDQAETSAVATYGNLEDQLYVIGLNPVSNGLPTGAPTVAGSPTITDHGASPVTWNSKAFSITITDSAAGNTGETLMRWIRYNLSLGGTFQGKDAFNWHDLVQTNGDSFKSVRGAIYGDTGAAIKGVRVVMSDGTTPHPSFNLFTADDGTTYAPPPSSTITLSGITAGSRVQLYDTANGVELLNSTSVYTYSETYSVDRTLRVRIAYQSGTSAKNFIEANIGSTSPGSPNITYVVTQTDDTVYNANAIDGSAVTGITISDSIDRMVINIATGYVSWPQIYAYNVYWLTTSAGIVDDGSIIIARDTANYIVSLFKIRNSSTTPLSITGGYGVDATTGTVAPLIDTAGSSGNIYQTPDHVIPYQTTGTYAITGDIATVLTAVSAVPIDVWAVPKTSADDPDSMGEVVQSITGDGSSGLTLAQFLALK